MLCGDIERPQVDHYYKKSQLTLEDRNLPHFAKPSHVIFFLCMLTEKNMFPSVYQVLIFWVYEVYFPPSRGAYPPESTPVGPKSTDSLQSIGL